MLALLWLWPTVAEGASLEYMKHYKKYTALAAKRNYDEAIPYLEKAVELAEKEIGADHPTIATLLNNLGALYFAQSNYEEAEEPYTRALEIWQKALGPDHLNVAQGLENYALLQRRTGRIEEAEKSLARAKAIRARNAKKNR